MLAHVCVQDHLDEEGAELAEVRLLHVCEDVAVILLDGSGRGKQRKERYQIKISGWFGENIPSAGLVKNIQLLSRKNRS